jgi:hypothetical protein
MLTQAATSTESSFLWLQISRLGLDERGSDRIAVIAV